MNFYSQGTFPSSASFPSMAERGMRNPRSVVHQFSFSTGRLPVLFGPQTSASASRRIQDQFKLSANSIHYLFPSTNSYSPFTSPPHHHETNFWRLHHLGTFIYFCTRCLVLMACCLCPARGEGVP